MSRALPLVLRVAMLAAALVAFAISIVTPGLAAVRIVTAGLALAAGMALWRFLDRTERETARFVEALAHHDMQARFAGAGGSRIGAAFDAALDRLRRERDEGAEALRHCQLLLDDMPVALLLIEDGDRVTLANKAARRMFDRHDGGRTAAFGVYGEGFARRLSGADVADDGLVLLHLDRPTRAVVRQAGLARLGRRSRAVTVEPVQDAINSVEMAAQTDIVRVLTHEILNSLTPVRSLAATAAALLGEGDADDPNRADGADDAIADARVAVATLARRAEGLGRFIESYRAVAQGPVPVPRRFAATGFAREMAQLFTAQFPAVALSVAVDPPTLAVEADPDLLAQAAINLLRNAARAVDDQPVPAVALHLHADGATTVIEVADNGPGVPPALRRDIFLPFFTTRAEGSGVGLNLVRQIAVAHRGSVEVDDRPGGGARFRMRV